MDSAPGTAGPISALPKRRPRILLRVVLASGVLLLAIILLLAPAVWPDPKIVWLTPSELARPAHSTVFAHYKYKLAVLVWPLIHNYWHGRLSINTDANFLMLSASAMEQAGLGAPFATNADGQRIWVLSPTEMASFQERLKTVPGALSICKTGVQTAEGRQGQARVRKLEDLGIKALTNGVQPLVRHIPIDLTVDVLPRIASGSIKLTIAVTATELIASQPGIPVINRTNLSAACRVSVPNAGGLIMEGGNAKDASGNTCLLIASPIAVDSRGNRIKL